MPWYDGPSLLELLESLPSSHEYAHGAVPLSGAARAAPGSHLPRLRRPDRLGHRFAPATRSRFCPRAARAKVERIVTWDGDLDEAYRAAVSHAGAGSRTRHQPRRPDCRGAGAGHCRQDCNGLAGVDGSASAGTQSPLLLKHTSHTVPAFIPAIQHRTDVSTLAHEPAADARA